MSNIIVLAQPMFDETYEQIELYRDINRQIKALTKQESEIKEWLAKGHFATHNEYDHNGRVLLTYDDRSREGIDAARLKAERPDIYAQYSKTTTYKQFTLK